MQKVGTSSRSGSAIILKDLKVLYIYRGSKLFNIRVIDYDNKSDKVYLCFRLFKGISASHMHSCMMPSPQIEEVHQKLPTQN